MGAPQYEQAGADIGGTGTTNTIPRWTGPTTLGDSIITQDGTSIGVRQATPSAYLFNSVVVGDPALGNAGITVASGIANDGTLAFADGTVGNNAYRGYVQYSHTTDTLRFGVAGATQITVLNTGNVGIGTASPVTTLHVARNGTTDPAIIGSGTNSAVGNFESSDFGRANRWTFGRDNSLTGNFVLAYNGSPLMNTTSSGNVGIGTATPSSTAGIGLTIYQAAAGSLYLQNATDVARIFQQPTNLYIDSSVGSASGSIIFRRGSTVTESARIDSNGNVGIGTASPGYRLHVKDATNRNMIMTSGTTGMKITSLTDAGAEADIGVQGNTVQFLTGGTERARIDSNGNVVINTAAIATNATNGFLYVPSCAGTPTGTPTTYTGRVPIVVDTTNHKLYFYSGGSWRDAGP